MSKKVQTPKHHEHSYRSLAKTLSYRAIISVELFAVTYLITRDTGKALELTLDTAVISTIIYYLHERVWAHISWGRTKKH
ncbi:DUF2061 domain-containing protein [bacterium]|nr:DUF2061 domain-containing protein [bacterium]